METWKAMYIGHEFPEYYGTIVEAWDDNSNPNSPCYMISLNGGEIGNVDDDELQFIDE